MLTKSLHTITAVTNVAEYILTRSAVEQNTTAHDLAVKALAVLGHDPRDTVTRLGATATSDNYATDPTVVRIVANCAKLLATRAKAAA